jgi:hypothetical protein
MAKYYARRLPRGMTARIDRWRVTAVLERRAAATLALALLLGLAAQYLFYGQALGLNFPLVTSLFLGSAWTLRPPGMRPRRIDLWIPASAFAFASIVAVRTDAPLIFFNVLAALALCGASVVLFGGVPVSTLALRRLIREALSLIGRMFAGVFQAIERAWPIMRRLSPRMARASGPLLGVLLAAPFVFVFAVLFSSADVVFARTLERVIDAKRLLELLGEAPGRLMIAGAVAWAATGALWTTSRAPRDDTGGLGPSALGAETATVALLIIDGLFAAFVVLQLAYLFGGRDTLDAAAISYSAYARRGFFELIAVVALVGGLLLVLELLVRGRGRPYLGAALALVLLTGAVLASAYYRLDLYQRAYGWSELRFYAFAAIAFLAVALAIFAWSVLRARMSFIAPPLVATAVAVGLCVNVIGPSGHIARANLARVIDPTGLPDDAQRSLDVWTMWSLGDGAVPDIVARYDAVPERDHRGVFDALHQHTRRRDLSRAPDWRSWNLDRERARVALAEWERVPR